MVFLCLKVLHFVFSLMGKNTFKVLNVWVDFP